MHTNTKAYFVYLGRSLLPNESSCITAGITHVQYRDYLKIMEIFFMLPCKSKAHALAVEKEAHKYLDAHYEPRAFVRWSKADFEYSNIEIGSSPTRTNEWWLVPNIDSVISNPFDSLFEIMRNRQLNWKEETYGRKEKGNPFTLVDKAKEGSKK
tara:strand:- start:216 stop:677 length:462 start_codon:yes stop_codon:yes gene_type:complete